MGDVGSPLGGRLRVAGRLGAAVCVAVAGLVSVSVVASAQSAPPKKVVTVRWVSRSRPVQLTIPAIHVSTPLIELGLTKGRVVQVPSTTSVAGWYKYGPAPGQESSAVILGHVDSYRGPGVFFRLGTLKYGQRVIVRSANGRVLQFAVIAVREYSKSSFPDKLVYGPRHYAALQLVTCGGTFDRATGHYLSNIVVFTALVKR
ncbi:MAG: class F sortase [Acidimicrobiales bacterium]